MDLSQNIHLLGDLLGQVISELESPELFETEERIRALAKARRGGDSAAAEGLQAEVSSLQNGDARVVATPDGIATATTGARGVEVVFALASSPELAKRALDALSGS